MANFRQKNFAEYDAMRNLYVEIQKDFQFSRKDKIETIGSSALIPILKGNNIVIEKFTIQTSFFGGDRYRIYLRIGAKAKLPDDVRIAGQYTSRHNLGQGSVQLKGGYQAYNEDESNNNDGKDKKKKGSQILDVSYRPNIDLSYTTSELKVNTLKYDKSDRSLVLEASNIRDLLEALKILPFGIGYKLYLLNA